MDRVPVFDAHEEFDHAGELVENFDARRLEEICRQNNSLCKIGHFSPIGPGHNIFGARDPETGKREHVPEALQPPIWAWATNFHVAPHPKDAERPCIYVDRYAKNKPEDNGVGKQINPIEEITKYPFLSVELHHTDGSNRPIAGLIDRVALLRTAPRRMIGPTCYSKAHGKREAVARKLYADPSRITRLYAAETGTVTLYAMEQDMPFDPPPTAEANADLPGVGDQLDTLDSLWPAIMEKICKTFGLEPKPEPIAPEGPPMDAPGGDLPLPGGLDAPGGDLPMPTEPEPALYSRNGNGKKAAMPTSQAGLLALRERELKQALADIAELKKARQDEVTRYSREDAEARATRLQERGKKINYDKVVARLADMKTKEARDEYEAELYETCSDITMYSRAPQGGMIPQAASQGPGDKGPGPKSEQDYEKVYQYQRDHGVGFAEAKVAIYGKVS